MISQELRTQLVFDASNALKNVEALHDNLMKLSRVDFSQLAKEFRELGNGIKEAQKNASIAADIIAKTASKTASAADSIVKSAVRASVKNVADIQKVIDSYQQQLQTLKKENEKSPFGANDTARQQQYLNEIAKINAEIANLYRNAGQAEKALAHMKEAVNAAGRMPEGGNIKSNYEKQLADLQAYIDKVKELGAKKAEAERERVLNKELEIRLALMRRLARLSARVAEIQAKVNERFSIGRVFSESEFVRLRESLRRIGVEMDRLTGKNVSEYMSSILDNVRIKSTPQTETKMNNLANQYNLVRKRAEEAAEQLAKTKSIADALRFNAAMNDLKEMTRQTEQINRMLGRTEGIFKQLTGIIQRRAAWHFGEYLVYGSLNIPSTLIQSYRELEQAMAGVQQVMPIVEGKPIEVSKKTARLIGIAADFARSAQEVTEGAQLWGRGYGKPTNSVDAIRESLEETNKVLEEHGLGIRKISDETVNCINKAEAMRTTNELVRQSAMLATVDNFSMAESVKGLEAVLASYGLRAKPAAEATLFAGRAVDIISKVAHYGQISAQDLVRGIEATGKAAEQA